MIDDVRMEADDRSLLENLVFVGQQYGRFKYIQPNPVPSPDADVESAFA